MKQRMRAVLLAAGLAVAAAGRAESQVLGLPVNNSGVATGLSIEGNVGFPNAAYGKGHAFGGSLRLGLSRIGVTGSASWYKPGADEQPGADGVLSVGGTLDYKLLGGPLIPLSATLQAGAGYYKRRIVAVATTADTVSVLRFPIGLGIGVSLPNPVFSVRPWVAPRVDIERSSPATGTATTNTAFAVSAGIEINTLSGLGIQASYDWSGADGHPQVLAAGLHYALRIPGL